MQIDTNISASEDLFGKVIADLQSDIVVGADHIISGTLKYVDDYTGFSGNPEEQVGNYIVLHASVSDVPDGVNYTIQAKITNAVTLDDDGIYVGLVRNKDTQTITFTASADGYESVTKTYALTGLTCEEAESEGT